MNYVGILYVLIASPYGVKLICFVQDISFPTEQRRRISPEHSNNVKE